MREYPNLFAKEARYQLLGRPFLAIAGFAYGLLGLTIFVHDRGQLTVMTSAGLMALAILILRASVIMAGRLSERLLGDGSHAMGRALASLACYAALPFGIVGMYLGVGIPLRLLQLAAFWLASNQSS